MIGTPYSGLVVDISNYSGTLTDSHVTAMQAAGVGVVIVRLSTEDNRNQRAIAAQQVSKLAERGVAWQGYLWCYWSENPVELWTLATSNIGQAWDGYYGDTIWFDAEDVPAPDVSVSTWLAAYEGIVAAEGFTPGLYSRKKWVDAYLDQNTRTGIGRFADWPLWLADPDGIPGMAGTVMPERWQALTMKQYSFRSPVPGLPSHDANTASGLT